MLHACAARFDVMFWGENFWELNTPQVVVAQFVRSGADLTCHVAAKVRSVSRNESLRKNRAEIVGLICARKQIWNESWA
jgi:hypothetical protein